MTRGLVMMAIVICTSTGAAAQTTRNELNDALARLQLSVQALGADRPARLAEAVRWLRERTSRTDPAQVSPQYVRTLIDAARLLSGSPSRNVIDDVTEELEAKVEHCRALDIGMGGSVVLKVNTRRGGTTVNNLQVFYLLKIYEHVSGVAPITFPTLSAPAETRLEPGRYWIWARDPVSGRTSERRLYVVSRQQEFRVDLPVQ